MFGKKQPETPENETVNTSVDTMPQPDPVPSSAAEEPEYLFSPPILPTHAPVAPEPIDSASAPLSDSGAIGSELTRLRDILFGEQSRSTEKRLSDLELRLEAVRQELGDLISHRVDNLDKMAGNQLTSTRADFIERLNMGMETQNQNLRAARQQLTDQLEQQNTDLTTQIRATQRELATRLETQQSEQSLQLREVQKELTRRLDDLTADFMSQLRQIHKELSDRLDKLGEFQSEQTRTLQVESKKRDDDLRVELMTLANLLDTKKVSRTDLGHILTELGQRMRSGAD
ncbi:MAG: hypothetical protein IPM39_02080 [Chloroflexi bacterium]|nr:hypothetical protein [Chloroflexota bacterium]